MDQEIHRQPSLSPGYSWQDLSSKPATGDGIERPAKRAPVAYAAGFESNVFMKDLCRHVWGAEKLGRLWLLNASSLQEGRRMVIASFGDLVLKLGGKSKVQQGKINTVSPPLKTSNHDATSPVISLISPTGKSAHRELLPPFDEVIQGCRVLSSSYFQLGFFPKAIFLERLSRDFESVSVFLLLSILSVSARFTPCIIERYGGNAEATEYFIARATELVPHEMYKSSLDRTQALFLLSIADWGNGNKNRSSTHMGLAIAMAGILCLHREETYQLPPDATPDQVVDSEMARRTFWMIESQTNLHSGHSTPFPFAFSDMTAQLPCEESDFAFGVIPRERAVLEGTQAAAAHPDLISTPSRSLFASLIQSHNLWGLVARRACRSERELNGVTPKPWEVSSEYSRLSNALRDWEQNLPVKHQWSIRNLRGYKAESLDLAYLSTVMVLRLSNIVLRRIYLPDIMVATSENPQPSPAPPAFWESMSESLFQNVHSLYEQIDAYLPLRSREEGFPPIIVFCAYICGSLASYLWKTPHLCMDLSESAKLIYQRCLDALTDLQYAWPMALRWHEALRKAGVQNEEPPPVPISSVRVLDQNINGDNQIDPALSSAVQPLFQSTAKEAQRAAIPGRELVYDIDTVVAEEEMAIGNIYEHEGPAELSTSDSVGNLPLDMFEAELMAFLRGEVPADVWDNWGWQ
ncbi:hypothetical protein BKA65DRAFT_559625 [Rhexocercosporidium sp. MPI-PUGE-AT-0058]|nr:hypothetical protein BKA65DRAFT_559625 [Rhexocercosporidium sp. MPI-PUGE-AT-0058]